MAPPIKLAHMAFRTDDVARLRAWYCDELQIDNFDTPEETTAFIESDVFAKNPIGVLFDADLLVERYRNGVPVAELVKQGSAPCD